MQRPDWDAPNMTHRIRTTWGKPSIMNDWMQRPDWDAPYVTHRTWTIRCTPSIMNNRMTCPDRYERNMTHWTRTTRCKPSIMINQMQRLDWDATNKTQWECIEALCELGNASRLGSQGVQESAATRWSTGWPRRVLLPLSKVRNRSVDYPGAMPKGQ